MGENKMPPSTKAVAGILAGMAATTALHPLDVTKLRLQLHHVDASPRRFARRVVRCEGAGALFHGLSAGLARQAVYTAGRIGVYNTLFTGYENKYGRAPNLYDKVAFGLYAGAIGAIIGTPAELAMVRLIGGNQLCQGPFGKDARKCCCLSCSKPWHPCTLSTSPKYKGLFNTLARTQKEEGVRGLWRGALLTTLRTLLVGSLQIVSYIQARETLVALDWDQDHSSHVLAAVVSSFVTSAIVLPVDSVKNRYQVCKCFSQMDILRKSLSTSGCLKTPNLWKGFTPFFLRMTLHTLATFWLLRTAKEQYKQYMADQDKNKKGK